MPDPLTVGQHYARGIFPDAENRDKDDFYPTPPPGTRALLSVERFQGPIWECACGRGDISRVLASAGYEVVSTDLVNRGFGVPRVDFLMERHLLAPNIVTNPPFKHAEAFVRRGLDLGVRKMAMLMRLAWLEGQEREKLFRSSPLARVWVFSRRLEAWCRGEKPIKNKGGLIAFAWFVWDSGHVGPPTLGWINPIETPGGGPDTP